MTRRMPDQEKPYRLYRGGRVKGKVPAPPRPRRPGRAGDGRFPGPGPVVPRRRRNWRRWLLVGTAVLLVLIVLWAVASWFAFRSGVRAANDRLDPGTRGALNHQGGLLISHPTTVLLLGTDHNRVGGREGDRHSDSIMLVHTDPDRHRISYLSIPRDLLVEIPGGGRQKVNTAMQLGGPVLALKTVRGFTGLPINHVVIVDFADFEDLIDALGGVDVDVPRPILSNRFDCPYATAARCQAWKGWRFAKGRQHMSGRRALIYSRIRENRLDPSESDFTRAERQQRVLEAIGAKLTSVGTLLRLPFVGDDLLEPLSTDLSAGQFLQLGWLKFRAPGGRALHCRLGGQGATYGGQSVIEPSEDNRQVVGMVLGVTAAQPPAPGSGLYGPGCTVGNTSLG
jgi:polyisoprenyl-teichoic acid--peptidoglycan teichoic acid transferase